MSDNYAVITDGSCDLPMEWTTERDFTMVPFYVSFDDENYFKENVDIKIRDFYQRMVDEPKVYPKSSMPSTQDYIDVFVPFAEKKIPVICICITTKFSGSMQSALNAQRMVLEDYPDAEITVIDSIVNTVLQGNLVLEVLGMKERGMGYQETINRINEIKETGRIFFTVGDMEYLKHGGRIGKVAGVAGSILGVKPVITLKQGEIFPSGIGRSRKKNLDKCIELLKEFVETEMAEPYDHFRIAIGYGYDMEEAKEFRKRVLELLEGKMKEEDIQLLQIGATIAVHTGPYPLGFGVIHKA